MHKQQNNFEPEPYDLSTCTKEWKNFQFYIDSINSRSIEKLFRKNKNENETDLKQK